MGTMRHLNWLNADKLQRYTHSHPSLLFSILHASVSFPPSGATTVTHVLRGEWNHPQGFFAAIFTSSWLSTAAFCVKTISCCACKCLVWRTGRVSIYASCVYSLLFTISPIFFLGRKAVSLFSAKLRN